MGDKSILADFFVVEDHVSRSESWGDNFLRIIGPFSSTDDAADWGRISQELQDDNPCWNVLGLSDPSATETEGKVVIPIEILDASIFDSDATFNRMILRDHDRVDWGSLLIEVGNEESFSTDMAEIRHGTDEWQIIERPKDIFVDITTDGCRTMIDIEAPVPKFGPLVTSRDLKPIGDEEFVDVSLHYKTVGFGNSTD